MTRTKTKAEWQWMNISKIPAASCGVRDEIEKHLKQPTYTSGSGSSQEAATAISVTVEAFRVIHTQSQSFWRGGVQRIKQREGTIGWIIRTTRRSRWQGEGTSVEYEFVLGEEPGRLDRFDCRFSDPVESTSIGNSIPLWQIQNTLDAEWAN